ncbi:DNA-3-methyladenine glycosylase [Paracoccus sp. IB05]|uniref:DNA-3-methyladenine glycosylase family protein n=1 Tax=Paracoccus sp. IB05 TaxID=2779367 RepID=UPI0018E806A1|nr:DNA-3-methyladenine glycosylase 2 family protein [Paracoccus sp. IB05]MBJ2153279.1 DNA-3-methyladenine glycosylase 2 family protein [Paracoccus sp. IB05]
MTMPRIILGEPCLAEGIDWLSRLDPRFAHAAGLTGMPPLRLRPDGFEALLDAIISQQVSVASATAIRARMAAAGYLDEDRIDAASEEDLRAAGLSRQKARYARALAAARLDYAGLRQAPTDGVIATLVALPGIGRWTAEIYAMFALGHADVFAPGDLALQESARRLFGLDERPSEKDLRTMSLAWAPWRSVAARLLWSYYRVDRGREGIMG